MLFVGIVFSHLLLLNTEKSQLNIQISDLDELFSVNSWQLLIRKIIFYLSAKSVEFSTSF